MLPRPAALLAATAGLALIAAAPPAPKLGAFGVDLTGMDRKIAPGDDFNAYVNGAWEARTPIPADRARWGGFDILREQSDARTRAVLEATAKDSQAAPDAAKAAALYASFMDEAGIEARGTRPLAADLARIAAISSPAALATAFGAAARDGIAVPIQAGIGIDAKNPDAYVVSLYQGGLGLPDRDYYLVADNAKYAAARDAYKGHVARMLTLAGIADAAAKAQAVFDLETQIAKVHWSRVESRQAEKRYNPIETAALATRFPGIDWQALFAGAHITPPDRVIVAQPSAVAGMAALVRSVPLETWRAYFQYHLLSARADVLPKAFVDEDFAFSKVLSGTPELKPRWKRGVDFVNTGMGEAVGQLYVARYFPPEAKAKADALVKNLLIAMKARLERVTWMTPETRAKALAKLASFTPKIGYPEVWRSYAGLSVAPDDAYANEAAFTRFDFDYDVARLGKPADRREWHMTPQTVNAYANPVWNEVVFPAAILQPPFFDPNADPAVNYGAIGAVIGHEISHHFDDQGRKYDATGRLADWWTATDIARFKAYTDRVVAQYSAYEPLPGVHVNGALTLGENMADLAGINVAHDAWLLSLHGKPAPVIDGYSGEQRFFLGFGQIWRSKTRDAALQVQLTTDPHTPGNFRPYVVRNVDAWYGAFAVKPGQKLYLAPDQRIHVW
ncbi:M13 family metallopeptidase [Sphingomonas morindae]|uniref:M13 family metallopeptidase n=1 Tax=Sphingomonas morindae TaxID=1541170 RepID=A0ABY4XD62_9SPHN|nr:M13 family metallopeptidase [Sphingomonas morindae]USI74857.1 M13 family metallopeptidase [Sphingomonas morindae]